MDIQVNYLFHLNYLENTFKRKDVNSLDYGCGTGKLVFYANNNGYNFKGVDNYYESINIDEFERITVKENIFILNKNGEIPFPDNTFEYVCSEQVFEHVKNLDQVLFELNRILKEKGEMLHVFPFIDYVIKEGHYGIPFFHWFQTNTILRKIWTYAMYKSGFGFHRKKEKPFKQWYKEASDFIDNYCFYRTKKEFYDVCLKYFIVERKEKDKLLFHLKRKKPNILVKTILWIIKWIPEKMIIFLMQKRGSVVLGMKKKI
jgi:ubiquinone/menaquinone biosynthesis C-methylase UbiE